MFVEIQTHSQAEQHSLTRRKVMSAPIVPALSQPEVAELALQRKVAEASLQGLADHITLEWTKSVAAFVTAGRLLIEARDRAGHGNFGRMFKVHPEKIDRPLPFSQKTAEKLMVVAVHPTLLNSTNWSKLPPHLSTLEDLARMDQAMVERGLARGRIHCEVTRAEVLAWIAQQQSPTGSSPLKRRKARERAEYWDTFHQIEDAMRNLVNELTSELAEPLQFSEDGRIISGVLWIPPFVQPWKIHPTPITAKHRCECGHVHEDRRTTR
jgi:hypothetical protein